jgi:hypothetical protein
VLPGQSAGGGAGGVDGERHDHSEPGDTGDILARLLAVRAGQLPADDRFAKEHPTLWRLLTVREGLSADGRNATSITLISEGAAYTVIVSVKSAGVMTQITLYTLQGCLRALDAALRDPATVWRPMKDWKPKKDAAGKSEKAGGR